MTLSYFTCLRHSMDFYTQSGCCASCEHVRGSAVFPTALWLCDTEPSSVNQEPTHPNRAGDELGFSLIVLRGDGDPLQRVLCGPEWCGRLHDGARPRSVHANSCAGGRADRHSTMRAMRATWCLTVISRCGIAFARQCRSSRCLRVAD